MKRNGKNKNPSASSARPVRMFFRSGTIVCFVVFAALSASFMLRSQSPNPNQPIPGPDANAIMNMHEQQQKKANSDSATIERKRQITDDSARLLKLATDLKAEVDKTSKDTLSVGVIRKAEEIEKLAHTVKEKMKLTMGGGN